MTWIIIYSHLSFEYIFFISNLSVVKQNWTEVKKHLKAYVIAYKKAIGVDLGYIQILIEYIISGNQCLYSNCAERSDTILNSINSVAEELFILLRSNVDYINGLSEIQKNKLKKFTESYHIYDDVFSLYQEMKL